MRHFDYFKNHDEFTEYKAGDAIIEQGSPGEGKMFAVKEGEVEIILDGEHLLETVEAGQFFGEMSLVDSEPRSAAAIAKTDCKIVSVDKYHFMYLTHQSPTFALTVMHVMADRIRALHKSMTS